MLDKVELLSCYLGGVCTGCKRPPCLLQISHRSHLFGVKSALKCESGAKKMPVIDSWILG